MGLFDALGVKNDQDLAALGGQFALALFVAYTLASVRRRYLIARHVNFFGKWKARRFALRSVIYILLWLAAALFVLYLYLD